jgi:nucleotide-binding universal stress UspA family protein
MMTPPPAALTPDYDDQSRSPGIAGGPDALAAEPVHILLCSHDLETDEAVHSYADYLANLLGGQTAYLHSVAGNVPWKFPRHGTPCDLFLFAEPEHGFLQRLLLGDIERRVAVRIPTSILVARQPRWPIKRILLVVRVETSEEPAVSWAASLAHLSKAQLTILPLVGAQPLVFGPGSHLEVGIESLLTPNTFGGEQLRAFLHQIGQWGVEGTLRIRPGDPLHQICREVEVGDHDLVVVGAARRSRWQRWLFGEMVGPLVSKVNRPLLIANTSPLTRQQPKNLRSASEGSG